MAVVPAYAAYLRVYEPLAAFTGPERRRWEAYVEQGAAPDRVSGAELEHRAALTALLTAGQAPATVGQAPAAVGQTLATAAPSEGAFVCTMDGVALVCPWRTELRAWEAMAAFRSGLPDEVADAFVPRSVAEVAVVELERWRTDHPDLRAGIETSTWHVPLRWFVPFDADERRLVLGRRRAPQHRSVAGAAAPLPTDREPARSLLYVTAMARARRRVARALAVLRRTVEDGPAVEGVEELGRWLEEFHPRSVVELDYGGLVHLVDDEALRADESARDVAAALSGLADGDADAAAAAYERVNERWRGLQAFGSAS